MAKLIIDKLVKSYNGKRVVNAVDLEINEGSVVGLLGPNGAGKTTTFYMTVGLIKPEQGHIILNDNDITDDPMYIRARKGIGYLPQETSIFKKLSVRENILAILEGLPLSNKDRKAKTDTLLEELRISHLAERRSSVLSGGERRRLEISRVLSTDPEFILLDEPFAGIDPLAVTDIQEIIGHLSKKGIGVLISDHNVRETLGVCDTAYIMNEGRVIESGNPEQITSSKIARQFYLGDEFKL